MADIIAKSLVGDTMDSVTGAFGGNDKKSKDDGEVDVADARRLEEEKRKDKHKKMEEEREIMRQQIRDKYNLKKKDPAQEASEKYSRGKGSSSASSSQQTSASSSAASSDNQDEDANSRSNKDDSDSGKSGKCSVQ